jgi:hypothetical protein
MSGWVVVGFYLALALAYLLALRWISRAWLEERWSARRVAIATGLLTTLAVGLPVLVSGVRDSTWIVGLVLLLGLTGFLISHGLTLWNYAERHGVRDELRRLGDKNRPQ